MFHYVNFRIMINNTLSSTFVEILKEILGVFEVLLITCYQVN